MHYSILIMTFYRLKIFCDSFPKRDGRGKARFHGLVGLLIWLAMTNITNAYEELLLIPARVDIGSVTKSPNDRDKICCSPNAAFSHVLCISCLYRCHHATALSDVKEATKTLQLGSIAERRSCGLERHYDAA